MKKIVIDVDNTICVTNDGNYRNSKPNQKIIQRIREYRDSGFEIVLMTSRNMRTYSGNVGLINANTLPILIDWLERHKVPYDEIHVGKPWCGFEGFYVDDKAIRPSEFASKTYEELLNMLEMDNCS